MMIRLVKNEMIKAIGSRKIHAFAVILLLIGIAPVIGSMLVKISTFDGQTYPLFLYGLTVSWVMPIFIIVLVSDMVAEDYVNGTLANSLIHPVTRGEVYAGKAVSMLAITLSLLVYTMILGYIIGTVFYGWGEEFMLRGGVRYPAAAGILITVSTFLSTAVPLWVFGVMVMFLALLVQSGGAVVAVSVGFMLLGAFLGFMVSEVQPYLVTTYFSSFANSLLLEKDYPAVMTALKVLAVYAVAFYTAGVVIFKKRDIVY